MSGCAATLFVSSARRSAILLSTGLMALLAESLLASGERRARRPARHRLLARLGHELGELGARILEIALPVAGGLAHHQDIALGIEATARQCAKAQLDGIWKDSRPFEVEAQLDLGRHFVHVLSARP